MRMLNSVKQIFKPKLKLVKGTRLVSFLFIGFSVMIAAGMLWAANLYYNIDTSEIVMEEVQRVTGLVKATAGLVVGANLTLPSGTILMATTTNDVLLGGRDQVLRFTGGGDYSVGFQAPTTTLVTSTVAYILPQHGLYPPGADYTLTWQANNQLQWKDLAGLGGISAVGDVLSGDAFTSGGTQGTQLWFYDVSGRGRLTIADLSAARDYTLPNLSGTITLTSAGLGTGSVLFANAGLIATSTNLFWDNTNSRLGIGTTTPAYALDVAGGAISSGKSGTSGQLRLTQGGTGYNVIFNPTTTAMTGNTTYYFPPTAGTNNYVLSTDGTGILNWESVAGVGGVTTTGGTINRVAKFTGASAIGDSSIVDNYTGTALTIESNGTTTVAYNLVVQGAGGVSSPLYTGTGAVTLSSGGSSGLTLDSASGIITLQGTDYIQTSGGYEIGKSGTQIMRGAVSIFGFDLPMRCNTSCNAGTYTTTTRIIENADGMFPVAYPGTTRKYRFSIRYADATTTVSTTWQVATSSDLTYTDQFTLPPSSSTDLAKGFATTTGNVSLPSSGNWFLRTTTGGIGGYNLQVYDIMLIALDQVN